MYQWEVDVYNFLLVLAYQLLAVQTSHECCFGNFANIITCPSIIQVFIYM